MGIVKLGGGGYEAFSYVGGQVQDLPLRGRGWGRSNAGTTVEERGGWGVGRFANRPYGGMDSGSGAGITGWEGRYGEPVS